MFTALRTKLQSPETKAALLCVPSALFLLFFLVMPLITIVVFSFWRTESYQMIADWNIQNYVVLLTERTYWVFLVRSMVMAVSVSILCLIYAYPVAYFIAKHGGQYKLVLVLLTSAPFLTGIILRVTALQQILGPIGLVNMAMTTFGFEPIGWMMYTHYATALGLVYLWIPFMILAIYLSLLNFNFELLEVAKVNGATPWRAFVEITWPLNWIGTVIGLILVFVPTLAASVTPRFLGGVDGTLWGNVLEHQFGATGTWALGSAMGVILFVISLLFIIALLSTVNLKRSGFTGKEA